MIAEQDGVGKDDEHGMFTNRRRIMSTEFTVKKHDSVGATLSDLENIEHLNTLLGDATAILSTALKYADNALQKFKLTTFLITQDDIRVQLLEAYGVNSAESEKVLKEIMIAFKMLGLIQPTVEASVSLFVDAGEQTASFDPFAAIEAATSEATLVHYNLELVGQYGNGLKTFGPDARLRSILRQELKAKGMSLVTDKWLKSVLTQWVNLNPEAGGQITLPRNPQRGIDRDTTIIIVAEPTRAEMWGRLLDLLANHSRLDGVLIDSAKYYVQKSKAGVANETGTMMTSSADDVLDPNSIKIHLEEGLSEITQLMNLGIFDETTRMLAVEHAYIILPAFQDAGVVRSFGVVIGPNDEQRALNMFLTSPLNPHKDAVAALKFSGATGRAVGKLAQYNPEAPFVQYLLQLGEFGRQYTDAVRDFAMFSPEPPKIAKGEYVGVSSVAVSLKAMFRLKIGGLEIEFGASATVVQKPIVPQLPQTPGDYRILDAYYSAEELQRKADNLTRGGTWNYNIISASDWVQHVPEGNRPTLAQMVIQEHPEIVWYKQMTTAVNTGFNENLDALKAFARELDIPTGSFGQEYDGAVYKLVEYAKAHSKWILLANSLRQKGIL